MADESLKIETNYAESSEILKTSLKLKGSAVALGFAKTQDEIPSGMTEIDKRIRHYTMVSLARNEDGIFYATADRHESRRVLWYPVCLPRRGRAHLS
jgi:uncharacterized protein (DUF169 family)